MKSWSLSTSWRWSWTTALTTSPMLTIPFISPLSQTGMCRILFSVRWKHNLALLAQWFPLIVKEQKPVMSFIAVSTLVEGFTVISLFWIEKSKRCQLKKNWKLLNKGKYLLCHDVTNFCGLGRPTLYNNFPKVIYSWHNEERVSQHSRKSILYLQNQTSFCDDSSNCSTAILLHHKKSSYIMWSHLRKHSKHIRILQQWKWCEQEISLQIWQLQTQYPPWYTITKNHCPSILWNQGGQK